MKIIVSAKEIEELLRNGGDIKSLPADAIFTPSARDFLRDFENNGASRSHGRRMAKLRTAAKPLTSDSPKAELEAFFNSPEIHALKLQICDIGRRLWQRAYVDGNGGNIAIRVGEDMALCTPTLVSKGFMKPEDMCLVDLEGNQLGGHEKAHERNPDASANHEAPAARGGDGALPSAACHRVCGGGSRAADVHDSRDRSFYRQSADRAVSHARHAGNGQAGGRFGGPTQHDSHGQSRRRFLEPRQRRGRLFQDGDHRGLLPHRGGGRRNWARR